MTVHADHHLVLAGVQSGIPMHSLVCHHEQDADSFYRDNEGTLYEYCLIQEWWDNDGFDIVGDSISFNEEGHLLLWTTWNYSSEPCLEGRSTYKEWKEGYDQDQAEDSGD